MTSTTAGIPARLGPPAGARLVVTGGCGGIGRALVAAALADGLEVAVFDLPASIERHPPPRGALAVPLDATDEQAVTAAFTGIARRWPALDGLVNLAGFARPRIPLAFGPYSAAKAGVLGLTRSLAIESAPRVRVNAIAPTAVDTAFLRGGTGRSDERAPSQVDLETYVKAIPLGRVATPEDIVGPILFLLGPAARYMTGQTLHINGGLLTP